MPFTKGHPGFKKKGTKHRETLMREERRAIFENQISQKWEDIINQLPPTYIADQYLGKAPDKIEHIVEQRDTNEEAMKAAAKAYADALRNAPD